MPSDFSRSLRTIESDRPRTLSLAFIVILIFVAAWAFWFSSSRVTIFASTSSARLEVDRENHPIDTSVAGRVEAVRVVVGQWVRAGDVLVELDAASERLARGEEDARLAPTDSQVVLLKQELAAQERALEGERRATQAGAGQEEAESLRARAAAEFAGEEAKRLAELQRRSLISELEAMRARNTAAEKQRAAESAEFALRRAQQDAEAREQDRVAQVARLRREIAALEGLRATSRAASSRIGYDIEQRTVRAPISGRIAEVTPLTPGSVVTPGSRICTIVPDGDLKVVASFAPAVALGRVRVGQVAHVKLDGFPWTQYGSPSARVSRVAGEPRDGTVRVELTLDGQVSTIPLQHGLPAEIDIEVEQITPAALVMRSIGAYTRLSAATP